MSLLEKANRIKEEKDTKILPQNIKKGAVVFGVTGTYEFSAATLVSIYIATQPAKTDYDAGETFDPTGMVVKAVYSDDSESVVPSYTYTPTRTLKASDTTITISYTEYATTCTATVSISVVENRHWFFKVLDYNNMPVTGIDFSTDYCNVYRTTGSYAKMGVEESLTNPGEYEILNPDEDSKYMISIYGLPGYGPAWRSDVSPSYNEVAPVIILEPPVNNWVFSVEDENGNPIGNIDFNDYMQGGVWDMTASRSKAVWQSQDVFGQYYAEDEDGDLLTHSFNISIMKEGYAEYMSDTIQPILDGETVYPQIVLETAYMCTLVFKNTSGEILPIGAMEIEVFKDGSWQMVRFEDGPDGPWAYIAPGNYNGNVWTMSGQDSFSFTMPAQNKTIEIVLQNM